MPSVDGVKIKNFTIYNLESDTVNKAEYEAAVAKKRAEKKLEEHLKSNKELRELFEKHPERKEMYIEKVLDSGSIF